MINPQYDGLASAELARLAEANLYAFMLALSRNAGAEAVSTPEGAWYSDPALISPMFNGVAGANASAERADDLINAAEAYFAARRRPLAFWWVGPSSRPADLGARLLAHGWQPFEVDAPSMAADLHGLPERVDTPAGFSIEIVRDEDGAHAWADTFNAVYETPPWAGRAWAESAARFGFANTPYRLYLGRWNGKPVATNLLFCGAGVASVFGVGTLAEARGRGIGAAITLAAYLAARELGYHTGVLFATTAGAPMYRRLGFRAVGTISRYLWRADAAG